MDLRQLKDKASEAFTKGRFAKAAELYESCCQQDPNDHQVRLRWGDALAKSGEKAKAVDAYTTAAERLAKQGFLPRAIAAGKLVLELEPGHSGVQQMLADLYAQRGVPQRSAPAKATPKPADPLPAAPVTPEASPGPVPVSALRVEKSKFDELDLGMDLTEAWLNPQPGLARTSYASTVAAGGSLLQAVESEAQNAGGDSFEEDIIIDEAPSEQPPRIPLFSDLPKAAFVALFDRCPLLRVPTGRRVFEQGSQGSAFYVICTGEIAIVRQQENDVRELARLTEGAFFGEMALLSGAVRSAFAESRSEDTQLLEISAPILAELSRAHPQIARALRKFCRERLMANLMTLSPLFRPLPPQRKAQLISRFHSEERMAGQTVISAGAHPEGLYVVLSGEVEVTKDGQVLAQLREGDLFGEMSLLTRSPATATVRTLRPTSLLKLPRQEFDGVMASHPETRALIAELTSDRKRRTEAMSSGTLELEDEELLKTLLS